MAEFKKVTTSYEWDDKTSTWIPQIKVVEKHYESIKDKEKK